MSLLESSGIGRFLHWRLIPGFELAGPPAQDEPAEPATWVNWAIASNHIADAFAYSVSSAIECPANIPVSLSTTTQTSASGREWVGSTEVKIENHAQLLRQLADEIELGHVKVAHCFFSEHSERKVLNMTLEQ